MCHLGYRSPYIFITITTLTITNTFPFFLSIHFFIFFLFFVGSCGFHLKLYPTFLGLKSFDVVVVLFLLVYPFPFQN
uniref:Uncharacterized protein n=1 Tax=Arundo donax TaxID=35708 RepID=A0A0A9FEK5_ARUDO